MWDGIEFGFSGQASVVSIAQLAHMAVSGWSVSARLLDRLIIGTRKVAALEGWKMFEKRCRIRSMIYNQSPRNLV